MKAKNIFLTGSPRCGKSTLIEKIVGRIKRPATGFFTVRPETSIEEVGTIMVNRNFHTLPVVDKGDLVGIVGKEDIQSGGEGGYGQMQIL